jgi:hypothetical protein
MFSRQLKVAGTASAGAATAFLNQLERRLEEIHK